MFPRIAIPLLSIVTALAVTNCSEPREYAMLTGEAPPLPRGTPAQGAVIVELIEVETRHFEAWLTENTLTPSDAVPLRRAAQNWIHKEKAHILDLVAINTLSGSQSEVRSVKEIRYPEGYQYPEIVNLEESEAPDGTTSRNRKSTGHVVGVPPTARTFKKRNVGLILKARAIIDTKTRLIDLTLSPDWVTYLENAQWQTPADPDAPHLGAPTFSRNTLATHITLHDGVYGFLGSGTLPEPQQARHLRDTIVIVFVRVDIDNHPAGEGTIASHKQTTHAH